MTDLTVSTSGSTDTWYVFEDPIGSVTSADATVTGRGTAATYYDGIASSADLDGDGVAEVVYSNGGASGYGYSFGGAVLVHDIAGTTGVVDAAAADLVLRGATTGLQLAYAGVLDPADVNGDGHVDLVVPTERSGVYVYLGDGLTTRGTVDMPAAAAIIFSGAGYDSYVRELDGDGAADFLTYSGTIWTGLAGMSGTLTTADATTNFSPSTSDYRCVVTTAITDLDGDGVTDFANDCSYYGGDRDYASMVMFFGTDIFAGPTADETQAFLGFAYTGSAYTYTAGIWDLDGDGDHEVVGYDNVDDRGRTYILEP